MTHPRDVDRPEGIELDEFGDREEGDGTLIEYIRFVVEMSEVEKSIADEFVSDLRDKCSDWQLGRGHGEHSTQEYIEMRKELHNPEDEPPIPDEVLEEQREKEAEYYRKS